MLKDVKDEKMQYSKGFENVSQLKSDRNNPSKVSEKRYSIIVMKCKWEMFVICVSEKANPIHVMFVTEI